MHKKSNRNSLRKDTHIKLEKGTYLTPLDYSLALPGLLEDMTKEELAKEIGSNPKEIDRFLMRFKVPTQNQCKEIRRILNARN